MQSMSFNIRIHLSEIFQLSIEFPALFQCWFLQPHWLLADASTSVNSDFTAFAYLLPSFHQILDFPLLWGPYSRVFILKVKTFPCDRW